MSSLRVPLLLVALTMAAGLASCEKSPAPAAEKPAAAPVAKPAAPAAAAVGVWTDDFDGMKERRLVRMLVVYSKTFYFIDKGVQRGSTYEAGMQLEKALNAANKDRTRPSPGRLHSHQPRRAAARAGRRSWRHRGR